jgi:A/G-specific adenine glycosylase
MENALPIRRALLKWYRVEARDLPWRKTQDPYKIWVSEIILQQTRVEQGLPYYNRFLEAFPTVESLAAASDDAVMKQWEGLGYYTRARNLHKAAQLVVEKYNGVLPSKVEHLCLLPGIGKYTAGAIASIAFGERAPILDGNVKRILARIFNLDASIDLSETEKELWEMAETLVPRKDPGDFNQAMMELGARLCTPKNPNCMTCPVLTHCESYRLGVQDERPVRNPKKPVPHKEIVVAVLQREGNYLIGRRPPTGLLGGLWEFPGGKVESGETHQQALTRECKEELGLAVKVGGLIATVNHAYTHFRVTLNVYRCNTVNSKAVPKNKTHTELRWIPREEFSDYAFPKGNHKFLGML